MAELLPIFPLSVVAFPGMAVPLHVFEDRYREMVQHLLTVPDPADRLFGIVAIREGYEVGSHEARSMYRTGCVVQLTTLQEYDDGRYDIAVVGRHRMRVVETDTRAAYLRARVEELVERFDTVPDTPVQAAVEAARALRVFERYRRRLADELGVDPSSQTQELHLQLLRRR